MLKGFSSSLSPERLRQRMTGIYGTEVTLTFYTARRYGRRFDGHKSPLEYACHPDEEAL